MNRSHMLQVYEGEVARPPVACATERVSADARSAAMRQVALLAGAARLSCNAAVTHARAAAHFGRADNMESTLRELADAAEKIGAAQQMALATYEAAKAVA